MKRNRDHHLEQQIEDENQKKLSVLHGQVQEIRRAADSIQEETKESNSFLDSFTTRMDRGRAGLNNTLSRFETVIQEKNNRLAIYIAGTLIVSFLIMWKYMAFSN